MKLIVGDRVKLDSGRYASWDKNHGKLGTVGGINLVQVVLDDGSKVITINKNNLKLIPPKPFTRDDLKTGMTVKFQGGLEGIVWDKELVIKNRGANYLTSYTHDLRHNGENSFNILQVKEGDKVVFDRPKTPEYEVTGYKISEGYKISDKVGVFKFAFVGKESLMDSIEEMVNDYSCSSFEVHKRVTKCNTNSIGMGNNRNIILNK